jgi:hypothetical protein
LRRHVKKGFVISKAKGWDSFLSNMRKKVPTPQPRTTIVSGCEIVHFHFLEMFCDLLGSSKFTDVNTMCQSIHSWPLFTVRANDSWGLLRINVQTMGKWYFCLTWKTLTPTIIFSSH